MRGRIVAAAASLGLVALLVFVPASGAAAAEPVGPVDEIMDVPSRTARSITGSPMADQMLVDLWRALRKPSGSVVAVPPKPITPAVQLTRGAAAGPLIGGFLGGFALGTGGLQVYGILTGDDPLDTVCGTPVQGLSSVLYIGMMPDCSEHPIDPNTDVTPGLLPATWGAFSIGRTGQQASFGGSLYDCVGRMGDLPAPYSYWIKQGSTWSGAGNFTSWGVCSLSGYSFANGYLSPVTGVRIVTESTSAVMAEGAMSSPDPLRTPLCTVSAGALSSTVAGSPYRESEGVPLSAEGLGCAQAYEDLVSAPGGGPGLIPDRITVESESEGGAKTQIADQEVPDFTESERKGLTVGNGHGLVLSKVVGASVDSCMTWAADCSGWWEETAEGTSTTSPYRCEYGGQAIDLAECGPYRNTFNTRTATPTITDPATGEDVAWSGQPNTGNSINPGVGPGVGPSPADACFETGWASVANPIDWVLVPVKCALVWAFVPRMTAVSDTVSALGESAGDVAAVDPLMTLLDSLPAGGGCSGIPFTLTFFGASFEGHLLEACDGYGRTAATVVNGLLTLALCTAGVLSVARYGAAVFGFVGPGGGFESAQRATEHEITRQSRARND